MNADVLVLGGGSAGLAAAVMAARHGASVILVERHGFSGGMGTASLVHTFCGLYLPGEGPPIVANSGFPEEIEDRMRAATRQNGPVKMGRVWVLRQHPVDFALIADDLLRGSKVSVCFHTEAIAARRVGSGWEVEGVCRGTRVVFRASTLVDASGDAILAALLNADAETTESPRLQRPAYLFGLQVNPAAEEGLTLAGRLVDGVRRGILSKETLGLHFRASGRAGERFGTLDLSATEEGAYDPLDPGCLSRLEMVGRAVAANAIDFLRREAEGWQDALITHWPVRAGVRESRRWRGKKELTGPMILSGERHPDEIALATWPLEFRETNRGPKLRYPDGDRPAGIPFGSLVHGGHDRLYVAGRCLSCDHDAQASIRVMGTCFATGQAAGLAAALDAGGGVPDPAAEIRRRFPLMA